MHEHEHQGSGFFQGFVVGLLVGAGLVFLFGTNKGKKVLQMLLEQVEENTQLSDLLEMPEDEDLMDVEDEEMAEAPAEELHEAHEEKPHKAVARVKRFFKGAPKKLVS